MGPQGASGSGRSGSAGSGGSSARASAEGDGSGPGFRSGGRPGSGGCGRVGGGGGVSDSDARARPSRERARASRGCERERESRVASLAAVAALGPGASCEPRPHPSRRWPRTAGRTAGPIGAARSSQSRASALDVSLRPETGRCTRAAGAPTWPELSLCNTLCRPAPCPRRPMRRECVVLFLGLPLVIDSGLMCYLWVKIYADCHSVMV